jgi:hypothetical protein
MLPHHLRIDARIGFHSRHYSYLCGLVNTIPQCYAEWYYRLPFPLTFVPGHSPVFEGDFP